MNTNAVELLSKVNRKNIWDYEPVFCFTSDIDWASECVLDVFFRMLPLDAIKLTTFVTHDSGIIAGLARDNRISRGIHPNFLANSSHGDTFKDVIETCLRFAPESIGFRSHRLFDVTDITHMLAADYGLKYVSNLGTTMANHIRPMLHESRLVHFPIFFEDGSHLYNELGLEMDPFTDHFTHPGIKIISFHPMNCVFNTPTLKYYRGILDSLSREQLINIDERTIESRRYGHTGIASTVLQIIDFVMKRNYRVVSMNELYHLTVA